MPCQEKCPNRAVYVIDNPKSFGKRSGPNFCIKCFVTTYLHKCIVREKFWILFDEAPYLSFSMECVIWYIPDNCHFFYTDTIFGAEILHPNARISGQISIDYTHCTLNARSKMVNFHVQSGKIYTGQKNLHWRRRPRRRQLSGMIRNGDTRHGDDDHQDVNFKISA